MDKQHVFTHRHDTASVLALARVFMTLIHCLLCIITYAAFIISWPLTSQWYMDPPLNFNFRNVWLFLPGPYKRTSFMVLSQWWINTRPVNEWASSFVNAVLRCNFYKFSSQCDSRFLVFNNFLLAFLLLFALHTHTDIYTFLLLEKISILF